jgi:hypothetical protein
LSVMVKHSPTKTTGAHISIIANITKEELLRGMLSEEMDNGFANRFLWVCSSRSKSLPEGGRMVEVDFSDLRRSFLSVMPLAREVGEVKRDASAADLWGRDSAPEGGVYEKLSSNRQGLFGKATARAAPQVLRLALVYALLDGCAVIRLVHLEAALEVWRYAEESTRFIFGDALGDPVADTILRALRAQLQGLTRTEIAALFGRNKTAAEIDRALLVLHSGGLARFQTEPGHGRATERWLLVTPMGARKT